jgi:hypothetical protein
MMMICSTAALLLMTGLSSPGDSEFYTPPQDESALNAQPIVDPKLPNVLLIGDSISLGYTLEVRKLLAAKANLLRPPVNCGDTETGLKGLDQWLGNRKWDVIHFNWGLWDLCYRNPASPTQGHRDKLHGTLTTSPSDYEKNLETLVVRLEKTGAKLIWANTTVVPKDEAGRFVGDDQKYNVVAARVMQRHGIPVDDLYTLTASFPPDLSAGPGNVHYTKSGYLKIAQQVADVIEKAGLGE